MNKTYCSRQLCQWLQERGCKVESEYHYFKVEYPTGTIWELSNNEADEIWFDLWFENGGTVVAYSWADILIFKAREFWGSDIDTKHNNEWFNKSHWHIRHVILFLQQNNIKDAEDYVREHSVFNNKK